MVVFVTGIAGAGKTTVGRRLAERLGIAFLDADSLHPATNVAKMRCGEPLTDADRAGWLARVADEAAARAPVVVACSALRVRYRDALRVSEDARFVLLDVPAVEAVRRVGGRTDHYFPPSLVDDQLATLERPAPDEDVIVLDATLPVDVLVDRIGAAL